jgi:hypothetical protein
MDITVPVVAQQAPVPGSAPDMAALEAETESLLPYKQRFVEVLLAMAAGEKQEGAALEELLAKIPEPLWPSVRRRFFFEAGIIAEKKTKRALQTPRDTVSTGVVFDMAAAILLMASGTYESIRDLIRSRLDLEAQVKQEGAIMLHHGVTPDMKMVEKLQRIILQAQKEQRERELLPAQGRAAGASEVQQIPEDGEVEEV